MHYLLKSKRILILGALLFLMGKALAQSNEILDSAKLTQGTFNTIPFSERKDLILDLSSSQNTNFFNSMAARTSGVLVRSSSGTPGSSSSIRIRGNRSILFDNSPLIIVDGVPIDNSINLNSTADVDYSNRAIDINQYDIESIQVLKSLYSNVIYGLRGANGVILITTKKAEKDNKMRINLTYGISIDKVNKLPGYQTEYAQGRPVSGVNIWRGPDTQEGFSWGPALSDLEFDGSEYPYDKNGRLVPRGTGNGRSAKAYSNLDDFFVNGLKNKFDLSIGGGKKGFYYSFTAGLLNQKGVMPNADFFRRSFKLNLTYDILEGLNANFSIAYINSGSKNRIQKGATLSGVALGLFRTSPSFDNGNQKTGKDATNDLATYQLPDGTQRSYRAGIYDNPFWSINKNPTSTKINRIISQLSLNYNITSDLVLGYQIGIDSWKNDWSTGADINSAKAPFGEIEFNEEDNILINSDITINYTKSLTEKFNLVALVGYNYFSSSFSGRKDYGYEFIQPGVFTLANTMEQTSSLSDIDQKIAGFYFSLGLDYAKQISLNISARNDWSSVLPAENNGTFFYGTEAIWNAARTFGQQDKLGLRINASWARTGNRPNAHLTSTYYSSALVSGDPWLRDGIQFPQFGVNGYEANATTASPNLEAEITQGYELGFDFDVLDSRIGLNYTYYNNNTDNVILLAPVSANTGFEGLYMNSAAIENKGHEISLFATPLKNRWLWEISLNFSRNRNSVSKLHENVERVELSGFTSVSSNVISGEPYGAFYGNAFRRNEDGKLIIGTNGWAIQDADNRVLGNPNPDWFAGIHNAVSYKGITISALLDLRQGGEMWNGTAGVMNYFGTSQLTADQRSITGYVFDGVVADANGEPSTIVNSTPVDFANPANGTGGNKWIRYGFGGLGEENIQDASWVRLREITITYELPEKLLSKIGVKSSSVSFTGWNLWLSTNYTGIDPETNLSGTSNGFGLDYFNSPNIKSYSFIFNFNF